MNTRIFVFLNEPSFEYDVRSLLRAFFPHADVRFENLSSHSDSQLARHQQLVLQPKTAAKASETEFWKPGITLKLLFSLHSVQIWIRGSILSDADTSFKDQVSKAVSVYGCDRPTLKNALKLVLYDLLSQATGKELPWGTLTGIRPVRLVLARYRHGDDLPQVRAYMRTHYRTSAQKTDLAYAIAERENTLIQRFDNEAGYCLYVGIPFCPSICLYCSFSSYPIARYQHLVEVYLDTLIQELRATAQIFAGRPLSAIYIGGGTPTSLSATQLRRLLGALRESFDLSHLAEWTLEAGRPDTISMDKLETIREFGDLRISINPQTFQQKTLDTIGRRHTTEDTRTAFLQARKAGFSHINMDLIAGLPGEDDEAVAATLEEVMQLGPDNLTVHSLALKRASRLREEWAQFGAASFHQSDRIMGRVFAAAKKMQMEPYFLYRQKDIAGNLENIGFAPVGKEGIYNILIMEEVQDIAACGAGAISKRVGQMNLFSNSLMDSPQKVSTRPYKTIRAANVKDVEQYIARIDEMIARKRELWEVPNPTKTPFA